MRDGMTRNSTETFPERLASPGTQNTKTKKVTPNSSPIFNLFAASKNPRIISQATGQLSVIYVPWEAFDIIYSLIEPGYDFEVGVYTTSCSNRGQVPDFVFTVSGVELRVPSTSYIVDLGLEKEGECVLAFSYTSSFSTPYALGTPFLYNYGVEWSIDDTTITFKNYVQKLTSVPVTTGQV
ncbi:Eukaryotic aspartyl protease [Aphelenchoides besseyi]|nr:Eukaryotic aspartyl protease [Aphelenchoides besseyi]